VAQLRKKQASLLFLAIALLMGGCTISISQPVVTPASLPVIAPGQELPATQIPVTWSGLGLSGRLVYLAGSQQDNNPVVTLESLELASGVIKPIFTTPPNEWIYAASVSPDEKQIVLSYAAPASFPALYSMPLDGSNAPQLLFTPPGKFDQYTEPVWSPDGKYIYFVHVNFGLLTGNQKLPVFEIERKAYPDGAPERLLTNAYWPRLSPDGSRLVYVSQNPNDGTNQLFVAAADGRNPKQVKLSGPVVPSIIDAPFFLPDGRTILFSAPAPAQSFKPDWLDWLFGVQDASAHNVISEWWSVPAAGGIPVQLTHIQAPGLYASVSPGGQWLASYSGNGIFVMRPDGSGLSMIVKDVGGVAGTVSWIP
jgi:Tol biopolymer transport system component